LANNVTHDGPAWAWVSSFGQHQNSRAAYLALKTHYFSDSFTIRAVTKADAIIENLYWDGRCNACFKASETLVLMPPRTP